MNKPFENLENINSFKEFFIKVSELKVKSCKEDLKILLGEIGKDLYRYKFGDESIIYLKDSIIAEMVLPCKNIISKSICEKDMQDYIIKNFYKIFPTYTYIGKEIKVENVGRIDILAIDNETHRHVIIELKLKNYNPNTQLLGYSKNFDNPILIGITENKTKEIEGVKYILFNEIVKLVNENVKED